MISFKVLEETMWLMSQAEKEYLERGHRKVNRKQSAKMWGISVNRLSECPWLNPDGDAQKGKRNAEWYELDVLEMVHKGKQRCKEEWDARFGH